MKEYFQNVVTALNECEIVSRQKLRISARGKKRKFVALDGLYFSGVITIEDRSETVNLGLTLIHEAIHHFWPDLNEKRVDSLSKELFCSFSTDQINTILSFLPKSSKKRKGIKPMSK